MSGPAVPIPQHCPTPVELDDLELLLSGAVPGVDGFNQPDSPLTLRLPEPVNEKAAVAGAVELVDPEGLPLARVDWPAGTVAPLSHAAFGPFRHLRLTPEEFRAAYAGRTVVPVTDALTETQLEDLAALGPVALLALVGTGTPALSPVALVRATLAAADLLDDAVVVTVPLADHGPEFARQVVATYAAGNPLVEEVAQPPSQSLVEEVAHRPAQSLVEEVAQRPSRDLASRGTYPPTIAAIVSQDRPARDEQGLVLFFTGLSGSGKSTLARALVDRLLEQEKYVAVCFHKEYSF